MATRVSPEAFERALTHHTTGGRILSWRLSDDGTRYIVTTNQGVTIDLRTPRERGILADALASAHLVSTNDTDGTVTAVMAIAPGAVIPASAYVLDEDNPHTCIGPGNEEQGMRCPACEVKWSRPTSG